MHGANMKKGKSVYIAAERKFYFIIIIFLNTSQFAGR